MASAGQLMAKFAHSLRNNNAFVLLFVCCTLLPLPFSADTSTVSTHTADASFRRTAIKAAIHACLLIGGRELTMQKQLPREGETEQIKGSGQAAFLEGFSAKMVSLSPRGNVVHTKCVSGHKAAMLPNESLSQPLPWPQSQQLLRGGERKARVIAVPINLPPSRDRWTRLSMSGLYRRRCF